MIFKIIKKGSANFWHVFNNGGKEVNISDFEAVLDSVAQTFNVQLLNGANIPNTSVAIADIIVIDETDLSIEETFATVELLRARLVELGYNPYLGAVADSITGLIAEGTSVTITGLGTLASPYIISSTGGSGVQTVTGTIVDNTDPLNPIVNVPTLQEVSDVENIVEYPAETTFVKYQTGVDTFVEITSNGDGYLQIDVQDATGEKTSFFNGGFIKSSGGSDYNSALPNISNGTFGVLPQDKTVNFTAEIGVQYNTNGTIIVTDAPTQNNRGYIVHVIGGTSTIGGVGYTAGALVYRYYDGAVWVSTNLKQSLQNVLDFNHDLVDNNNFQGTGAGVGNTGQDVNAFGEDASVNNSGFGLNAMGFSAGKDNTGSAVNAIGEEAGFGNTANSVNAIGNGSAKNNSSTNVNAIGSGAGENNTFKNVNLFGFQATADAENQNVFSKWISGLTKYLGRLSFNNITADRKWELPDASGTIALISDTITDGVTTIAPSQNAVFDALAIRQQYLVKDTVISSPVTGTLAETSAKSYTIPANTLGANDYFRINCITSIKTGTADISVIRVRISNTNTFAGSLLISTTAHSATAVYMKHMRDFAYRSGILKGAANTTTVFQDKDRVTTPYTSTTIDFTQPVYVFVSIQNSNLADSTVIEDVLISN